MNWVVFWLFIHITSAVIAFGPIFVFPIVGIMAQRQPQHGLFAAEISHRIETLVTVVALSMLVSGTGLLIAANIDLLKTPYLIVAILLYLIATAIALFFLRPTQAKLIAFLSSAPAPTGPVAGPPPEVAALTRRLQIGGTVLQAMFLVIIFLMIVKPGGLVNGPLFG